MIRRIPVFAASVTSILIAVLVTQPASAGNRTPVYAAADAYRDAVKEFERQVLRTPSIRSSVKRLVDDLEDSTSRLESASRDPQRLDRLISRYVATDALHARVELTFFGDPLCPPGPQLEASWLAVYEAYGRLSYEIRYLQQLRHARRGEPRVPVVDHRYDTPGNYLPGPLTIDRYAPVQPPSVRSLEGFPTPFSGRSGGAGTVPGAQLQRSGGAITPTRQRITTREQLRSAVLGAMLERE